MAFVGWVEQSATHQDMEQERFDDGYASVGRALPDIIFTIVGQSPIYPIQSNRQAEPDLPLSDPIET